MSGGWVRMGTYRRKSFLLNKFNKFKRHCAMFRVMCFKVNFDKSCEQKTCERKRKASQTKAKTRVAAVQVSPQQEVSEPQLRLGTSFTHVF